MADALVTTYSHTGSRGLPWTAVKSPTSSLRGSSAQELGVFVAQLCRRPARGRGRVHVELLETQFSDCGQVVVPGHTDVGVFTQQVDAPAGVRAVTDEIAEFPDLVESAVPAGVVDHALERFKIGVYV